MADPNDVEPQLQAELLRDSSLRESRIPWEQLSVGVSSGPTLSTFTIRPKGKPEHPGQVVLAANWEQFREICQVTFGSVPATDEYDIQVEGMAAND